MSTPDPRSAEEIAVPDDVSVEMIIEGLADAATGHTPDDKDGEPDQPDQPAPPKDTPHPG